MYPLQIGSNVVSAFIGMRWSDTMWRYLKAWVIPWYTIILIGFFEEVPLLVAMSITTISIWRI